MSTCEIWADGNTIFGAFAAAAAAAAYLGPDHVQVNWKH